MRIIFAVSSDELFFDIQSRLQTTTLNIQELIRVESVDQILQTIHTARADLLVMGGEILATHPTILDKITVRIPTLVIGQEVTIKRFMEQYRLSSIDDYLATEHMNTTLLQHRISQVMQTDNAWKFTQLTDVLKTNSQLINQGAELDVILSHIIDGLRIVIKHDACNIMLLDTNQAQVVHYQGYDNPSNDLVVVENIHNQAQLRYIHRTRSPLVIEDTQQHADWSAQQPQKAWIRAYVGVPIMLNDDVIGFINIENKTTLHIDKQQLDWLNIFANQIGNVLHNARLNYEHTKQYEEAQMLRQLIDMVTSTVDLDRLITNLLEHLQKVISYDVINIYLVEGEDVEIVATKGDAQPEQHVGVRFKADRYHILRELERKKRPIVSSNTKLDPLFNDWHVPEPKRSWMGAPLFAHGACIGYMTMENEGIAAFYTEQVTLLHTFANQAAIAIYNAQLYEEIRRYTLELEERVNRRTAELNKANQELKRSERQYRALFEATFEGICVHENGQLIDVNSAFGDLFDYVPAELVGKPILSLFAKEEHNKINDKLFTRTHHPLETIALSKNGKRFPVEILSGEYDYEGRNVRVIAVRDISERKALERQMLEVERMHILADFIAKSSHEFRTPLSIIGTNAYMLKRRAKTDNDIERLGIIESQISYITRLVDNMTILSKLDYGDQAFILKSVDMNQIVDACHKSFMAEAAEKQITLNLHLADRALYVKGDEDFLYQAIHMICDNAIQYTNEGGTATIQSFADEHEQQAIIIVKDTGIGISDEDLPHVFDRFYRADKAATTRGFGLGLSIARSIIQNHRGTIRISSELDKGTVLEIRLPMSGHKA